MTRKRLGIFAGVGCLLMLAVPLGIVLLWRWANTLPAYPLAVAAPPVPNALDDYVEAARLASEAEYEQSRRLAGQADANVFLRVPYFPEVPTDLVRGAVEANRPALARLREGFRREYASLRYSPWSRNRPRWLRFWTLARALRTEGELSERQGRPADAARSYLDCLRLGTDLPRGAGDLVAGRMGLVIQNIGLEGLHEIVDRLDGASALRTLRDMQALNARAVPLAEVIRHERDSATASLLTALRHPGSRFSLYADWDHRNMQEYLRFSFTPKRVLLDRFRAYMDRWAEISRQPYHAAVTLPRRPFDPVSRRAIPNLYMARLASAKRDALWRLVECRLALSAHRSEHGDLPESLDALVPHSLPELPEDPFAPRPLTYRREGAGYLLYSLGPDGDDDGGRQEFGKLTTETDSDLAEPRILPP